MHLKIRNPTHNGCGIEKGNRNLSYAESFFLPLFLLLLMTFLPPVDAILFLNPCTLLLCLFLGWYVLFIVFLLLNKFYDCASFILTSSECFVNRFFPSNVFFFKNWL